MTTLVGFTCAGCLRQHMATSSTSRTCPYCGHSTAYGGRRDIPGAPLARVIRRRMMQAGEPLDAFCSGLGTSARAVTNWEAGGMVSEVTVDRLLIALGLLWFDVWSPEEFPRVAALFDSVEAA